MSKLSELLKKAKAQTTIVPPSPTIIADDVNKAISANDPLVHYGIDRYGKQIQWNAEQWRFIDLAAHQGKSAILIGAAGTGKTTTMQGTVAELLQTKHIPVMRDHHKHLPTGTPGIVFVSYTRRAVMNLRRALPEDMKANCITIHKLLEYQPVFYEIEDPLHPGEFKKTMRFEPNRCITNRLDPAITKIVFDESSMVDVPLFHKVWSALYDPMNTQFIFLGDIQQLPPIFGSAILGFKMLQLPVVELTTVYRQALESPIIRLAHRILSGNVIHCNRDTTNWQLDKSIEHNLMFNPGTDGFEDWKFDGKLTLHPWKKKISADSALLTIAAFFKKGYDTGNYNPDDDMILIPFNKACGTIELNKHIANHIARKKDLVTHEVIAGFAKHYFTVGDKVLFEKEDAEIIEIKRNPVYAGKWPQHASNLLDYWGCVQSAPNAEGEHHLIKEEEESDEDIDKMLAAISISDSDERVKDASHIITVRLLDSEREIELKAAGEVNALVMSYALTVHKSQGSEWRRVFFILHQSHNTMIQRELMYTACTRAREELYVICEPDSFEKGITGQRIRGNTLVEKAEFFKGKLDNGDSDLVSIMENSNHAQN